MGQLTTHILDVSAGSPAANVNIDLFRLVGAPGDDGGARTKLCSVKTNSDGRCDHPLLSGEEFSVGSYELLFHIGDYFDALGVQLPNPKFIDVAVIRFGVADNTAHYHVPLLVSPYGYSTYRGS